MMKTTLPLLLIAAWGVQFAGCQSKGAREIRLDLHIEAPLSGPNDGGLPREVLQLLRPLECPDGPNAFVTITVYRHDYDPPRTETLGIPLQGANQLRKSLDLLAFEHRKAEYDRNAASFPNQPILSMPAPDTKGGTGLEGIGTLPTPGFTFLCCDEQGKRTAPEFRVVGDFDGLLAALRDSCCSAAHTHYNILYRNPQANRTALPTIGDGGPIPSAGIEAFFNQVGDKEVDPEKRLDLLRQNLDLFAPNAYVKEVGEAGTVSEPVPLVEYLEKIALYRSLEKIYVVEALQNEEGRYWEIRLKERHSHLHQ